MSELDLVISKEISNGYQLYASDRLGAELKPESQVKVLVSWASRNPQELQVEVRSHEPLLRSGTRCEHIAIALKRLLPPRSTTMNNVQPAHHELREPLPINNNNTSNTVL
jgi:hypothetical protein